MHACGRACVCANLCGCALPRCFVVGRRSSFSHAHNPTRPERAQEGLCLVCHKEEIQVIRLVLLMSVCVFCWLALPSVGVVRYGHMTDRITHATNPPTNSTKVRGHALPPPDALQALRHEAGDGGKVRLVYVVHVYACGWMGGRSIHRRHHHIVSKGTHTHTINTTIGARPAATCSARSAGSGVRNKKSALLLRIDGWMDGWMGG